MSVGFCLGALLALYYLVGRWSFARLGGEFETNAFWQEPRFWLVACLAAIAIALHGGAQRQWRRFNPTGVDLAVLAFLGYMMLSRCWAPDETLAADKFYELLLMLVVAAVICVMHSYRLEIPVSDGFWITVVAIGFALGGFALLHSGDSRAYAPGGGPNTFGRNMGLAALGILYLASRYGAATRVASVALVALAALLVVRSGSRGGFLAFSVAAATYTVGAKTSVFKKAAVIGGLGAATALMLSSTSVGVRALDVFRQRIMEQTIEDGHMAGRDVLWEEAWYMALEKPLFGWGLNGYRAYSWTYPHNVFLETLAEGGSVGLALLTLLTGVWCVACFKGRARVSRLQIAALALVFTAAQTSGDLYDSRGVFMLLALSAPQREFRRRKDVAPRTATFASPHRAVGGAAAA